MPSCRCSWTCTWTVRAKRPHHFPPDASLPSFSLLHGGGGGGRHSLTKEAVRAHIVTLARSVRPIVGRRRREAVVVATIMVKMGTHSPFLTLAQTSDYKPSQTIYNWRN